MDELKELAASDQHVAGDFYVDHDRVSFAPLRGDAVEIDLHAAHESDDGTDLMIEVKDWESVPSMDAVRRFVAVKNALGGRLERRAVFLFYSESGLGEDAVAALHEAGVLVLDPAKLAGYESSFQV